MKIALALAVVLFAGCTQEPAPPLSLPVAESPDDSSVFAPIKPAGWSQLRLGMSDDAAFALIGSPDSVHTRVRCGGLLSTAIPGWSAEVRQEQWVYGRYYPRYLYFDNGRLVAILD